VDVEATLESQIQQVTIYRRGAVVTRAAALPPGPAPAQITLASLPLALDDGSVRARVVAANGASAVLPRATDVRIELALPDLGEPIEPPSAAELRSARDEIERIDWKLARLDEERGCIDRLVLGLPERIEREPPRPVSASAWVGAAEWAQRAKASRGEERARLRKARQEAREQLARLERQVAEAKAERGVDEEALSKRAVVRLQGGEGEAPATLLLEYRVPGASWRPSYVVRVARDGQRAQLSVRALVAQRSGEPWERVKLACSTADLLRQITLPELKSIRIGRRQAEPSRRAWREPPRGAEALFEDLDVARASAPVAPEGSELPAAEPPPPPQQARAPSGKKGKALSRHDAYDKEMEAPMEPEPMDSMDMDYDDLTVEAELAQALSEPMPDEEYEAAEYDAVTPVREEMAPMPAMAPPSAPVAGAAPEVSSSRAQAAPMRMKASRKRSSGLIGGLAEKMSDALFDDDDDDEFAANSFGAGSADEPTNPGMPGGGGAGVALRARRVAIKQTLIDYSELQLVAWDAPAGDRGALRPRSWRDQLPGLSASQLDRVGTALQQAAARAATTAGFASETCDVARSSGAFDYRYDAAGPVDVPADGEIHSVPLFGAEAKTATTLVVVPRESEQAVRVASMRNPLHAPILAGPADIYLDQEFLVASSLDTVPAGADLDVGLGVEEALKVARNTHYREEAQGLLRGGTGLEHEVEVEVASRLATPVTVEVRERIPIKEEEDKDKEILIEEGKVTPPWEVWEQTPDHPLKGGRRWRLELGPGESQKLSYSYSVHIDAKNELVGGNRRERG